MSVRQNGAVIAGGGTKDMLTQKNITNCITEIPQDIKLELNAGTLTLKAGSKVYVPNGAGVFDEITIASDLTHSYSTTTGTFMVYYDHSAGVLRLREPAQSFSGTTAPTSYTDEVWYDTTNNIIKFSNNSGSTWSRQYSFPICIGSTTSGVGFTSIDQVFNGFGYIGSTVFALPGVKGLIPNGRNSDGTLSNEDITTTSVITMTGAWGSFDYGLYIRYNSSDVVTISGGTLNQCSYDESKNKNIVASNEYRGVYFVHIRTSSDKISRFTPHTVFHAVDYSDSEYIANCAMPSKKSIELSLGASGTTYTAPADGVFTLILSANASNNSMLIQNNSNGDSTGQFLPFGGAWGRESLIVSKGHIIQIDYTSGMTAQRFRFIYAQGSK